MIMSRKKTSCPGKYLIVVLAVDLMAHAAACRQQLTSTSHCEPLNSMTRNMSPAVRYILLTNELVYASFTEIGSDLIP